MPKVVVWAKYGFTNPNKLLPKGFDCDFLETLKFNVLPIVIKQLKLQAVLDEIKHSCAESPLKCLHTCKGWTMHIWEKKTFDISMKNH